ncbi:MAG: hypothetical protein OEW12_06340 [Deltaproteobacteria bacterium]|nr:hypothetical protein [Deltaproteobacteria bacterium]
MALVYLVWVCPAATAQDYGDFDFEDDPYTDSSDGFSEESGGGGGGEMDDGYSSQPQQDGFSDFQEEGGYSEESPEIAPVPGNTGSSRSNLSVDRQQLPLNAAWGAATGLLIGSWFALINNTDNRATLRSIGLGTVLGTLLGITVGMKSVFLPPSGQAQALSPNSLFDGSSDWLALSPHPTPDSGLPTPLPLLHYGFRF